MHSRIFQISKYPIKEEEYAEACHYCENHTVLGFSDWTSDDSNRTKDIEWLKKPAEGAFNFKEDGSFIVADKKKYFGAKYRAFKEQLRQIQAHLTPEYFSENSHSAKRDISLEMYLLNDAYNETFGFYADFDGCGVITMDEFVRNAEEGETYYIGGTVDYHY